MFPIPSPRHPTPFHLDGLGRIAYVLCVAACPSLTPSSVPAASRSPRLSDTISGAEARRLRLVPLLARRNGGTGASGLVMAIMRPLRLLTPCVPRIARRRAASRIAAARPFRFLMIPSLACSRHTHRFISPRLIDTRDGERGGADTCLALRIG